MATINLPEEGEAGWGPKINTAITAVNDDVGLVQTEAAQANTNANGAVIAANDAQATANSATTTANAAQSTASAAQADATQALNEIAALPSESDLSVNRTVIYYGQPRGVNQVWDNEKAAQIFSRWDIILFGDGLQDPGHAEHANTIAIITRIKEINTRARVFGYVSLGVNTAGLTEQQMKDRVDAWQTLMGVQGMILDEMGYEYEVSRTRQNVMIDYVHSKGMSCFLNVWNQDDVFSTAVEPTYNPGGIATTANATDFTFLESWVASFHFYDEPTYDNWYNLRGDIISRADDARTARDTYGVKIIGGSVVDYDIVPDEEAREYFEATQRFARIFGFDGWSCDAYLYSSGGGAGNAGVVKAWTYDRTGFDKEAPYTLVDGWVFWSTMLRYDTGERINLNEGTLRWYPDHIVTPNVVSTRTGNRIAPGPGGQWARIDTYDHVDISSDPDRMAFYFDNQIVGWHNEYGEVRARSARETTTSMRAHGNGPGQTAAIFQARLERGGKDLFSVLPSMVDAHVGVRAPFVEAPDGTRRYFGTADPETDSAFADYRPRVNDYWYKDGAPL